MLGVAILAMGFFAFNTYIYEEKQSDELPLVDGVYLGHLHAFMDNNTALEFDDVRWLSGDEGIRAAIDAGLCTQDSRDECLPNDYIITNDEVKNIRVPVQPSVRIIMQTWKMQETGEVASREISLDELSVLINDSSLHWYKLPYRITVSEGSVSLIEEVYVP